MDSSSDQNKFVTLLKSEEQFMPYLLGSFSDSQKAIPIHSFSVNTPEEKVTFELKSSKEIIKPSFLKIIFFLSRPMFWSLTLGPVILVLMLNSSLELSINWLHFVLCMLSVFSFHISAFALNDYYDHIAGVDRINQASGSQVIQKAWMSALQVKHVARLFLALGVLFGLPILFKHPLVVSLLGGFAILSFYGFSYVGKGLKYRGFGEFITFMALGPCLMVGLSFAISKQWSWHQLWLGVWWGWAAMLEVQLKNWKNIMADSQAGVKTFICRLGFDQSKYYLCLQVLTLLLLSFGILFLNIAILAKIMLILTIGILSILLCRQILLAPSPLSSNVKKAYLLGIEFNWGYFTLMTLCLGSSWL